MLFSRLFYVQIIRLEWHSHGKMEAEVALEIRIEHSPVLLSVFIGWVDCFHAHVKPQDEIIEI